MIRMKALVAIHNRENIKISSLNINIMLFHLSVCFLNEVKRLRCAKEGMLTAIPNRTIRM